MFLRGLTTSLIFAIILWPTALQAQVSQTASFTLSVTIPETAATPAFVSTADRLTGQVFPAVSPQVYTQLTTRDNETVLLESYVVN